MSSTSARSAAPDSSPLLRHLAGEAAGPIAALWPAPHGPYLTASAGRRHLLGLVLAQDEPLGDAAGEAALFLPLRRAIPLLLPAAPAGLRRALERMGEDGWSAEAYRQLLAGLNRPEAAKVLRHAEALTPALVAGLAVTPEPLLQAGLGRLPLGPEAAELAVECFEALQRRDGSLRARALAARWRSAIDAATLFRQVKEDLTPEPAPCPLPATPRLRWLRTKAEMREAALRYRNCLAGELACAAEGRSLYGEWLGQPGALVEVSRDMVFGWRLDQARAEGNEAVPEPGRAALHEELTALGVHVGRSGWDLLHAAERAAAGRLAREPMSEVLNDLFGGEPPAAAPEALALPAAA